MLIKKKQSMDVRVHKIPSKHMSSATVFINGRHPEQGMTANMKCEEIYYVISGSGVIHTEAESCELVGGDMYFIPQKTKYYVEGKNLEIITVMSPKWTPTQAKKFL